MLSAKISFFLCFYTLISKGAWRPVLKRGRMLSSFFRFCLESGHPNEKSASISFLRGTGWGKSLWGGASRKRENRGVKFIGRLNMRFLLHIITTQQGTFSQGLSYPSSNQFKSNPLGLLRYLHIVRTKNWDIDKDRNNGGAEDGEKETEI